MASLSTGKDGKRKGLHRVLLTDANGKRQQLYLGRIPKKDAEGVRRAVTELERSAQYGHTAADFALAWLSEAGDDIHERLVKFGLATPRVVVAPEVVTLGGLVERYQGRAKFKNLKPATQRCVTRCLLHLLRHFDPTTPIEKLTAADASDFYETLRLPKAQGGHGLAVATANLTASIVTTMFFFAMDAELIERNVFRKLPRSDRRGNNVMVDAKTTAAVLAQIHGIEDRLLFGLARFGGVRTMSEQRGLTWGDVDWQGGKMRIHSPKTERHEGKEARWIPLFPELLTLLEKRFHEAEPGEKYLLPSYHHASSFRATTMLRNAIRRAGLEPWSRLFHSLRATRQSELAELYPAHVVSAWIGNSVKVAEKHYLMVSDDHFANATRNATQPASDNKRQASTPEDAEAC